MKTIASLVLCLALLWPGCAAAARLALVVGINEYDNIAMLSKAVGDAEAMAAKLTELGFEVTKVLNPDRRELNQAVTTFRRSLGPGDAALVHFSGHGVEVNGRNLLLPRDIPEVLPGEEDYLIEEALDLGELMDRVAESGADVRIFIIDACRRNPLDTLERRGVDRLEGLAPLDPPKGSFVLYSAGTRQSALDGLGPDDSSPTSVYTRVLLEKLEQPGLTLSQIAREVRVEVAALAVTVGHTQSPAYYDELNEEFVLSPETPVPVPALLRTPAPAADDAGAFELAKSFNTIAAWQAFLKTYDRGFYADMARVALEELLRQKAGVTEIVSTVPRGVVATFGFPLPGEITAWEIYFAFETECENDHHATVTSPTGRRIVVMDRGIHRCSGAMTHFDGLSSSEGGSFVGTEAQGRWTFSMKDLDANAHSGILTSVWMKLTVRHEGVTSEYKVTLDGLPKEIPNPG